MGTTEASALRTVSVSDFKSHCTEELRLVEESGERIAITRHGKTIAFVEAAQKPIPKTIADVVGSLKGSVSWEKSNDLESAIPHTDWAMHGEDSE